MQRRLYVSIRLMPAKFFPVDVHRRGNVTLQIIDPRSTC